MAENEDFWDFYWEVRLQELQNLGKRESILAVSRLIRQMEQQQPGRAIRLLELGSGEGQILGPLAAAHTQVQAAVGVDYLRSSVEKSRRDYPNLRFIEGDFTDPNLLAGLGTFHIVILVNALHEVFSDTYSEELGEVDVPEAKARVEQALGRAAGTLEPGGYVALFDGLEPPGDPQSLLRIRFRHRQAREHFDIFARTYHPFIIRFHETGDPLCVEVPQRDFTRYITKSIFLGKRLWEHERFESYQYYTETEFRSAFANQGLEILELRTLTVDYENWRSLVEIETPGADFPEEHIWILAQKR
jgi:SAM-dependent methyltransferase